MTTPARPVDVLRLHFGVAVQENVSLAPYTSARIGGNADALVTVKSADEFADVMKVIWEQGLPFVILGGGSNVLVSDKGVRGVVVLDRAKDVRFESGDHAGGTGGVAGRRLLRQRPDGLRRLPAGA